MPRPLTQLKRKCEKGEDDLSIPVYLFRSFLAAAALVKPGKAVRSSALQTPARARARSAGRASIGWA